MSGVLVKIVLLSLATVAAVKCRGVTDAGDLDDLQDPGPEVHAGRLPRDTEPIAYSVRLAPKYDNETGEFQFGGQVEILIRVNHITACVTLNARDIVIKDVAITEYQTQTDVPVVGYKTVEADEHLVIQTDANLLAGRQYQVKVVFLGYLRPDMTGFYRSTYTVDGVNKWMAISQFKYAYARRAFPCYDDPMYKTPFNVSLGRQQNQMSLSNMPRYMTQKLQYQGWWVDHFKVTPPIPTYSVAAVVGELKKMKSSGKSNVNIYTNEDYVAQTEYVLGETPALIAAMENYTDSQSVMKKLDLLAIPDFDADGVENWGLNAYRERYMFFDNDSKAKFKEQAIMIVQKQQSHQWFSNLVTCEWWDFVWLNEGFGRYFQYFASAMVKPDWRLDELFVVEQHQTALAFDQTPRHPINTIIKNPNDILDILDSVTYNKAAAVLRMIKHTVSEVNFQKPLNLYLKHFNNSVVKPEHLWAVFENYFFESGFKLQDGVSFTNFALSWTDQSGYPVINVTRDVNTFKITQEKFSIWPSEDNTTTWYIGITYTTSLTCNFSDLSPIKWLKPSLPNIYIRDLNLFDWFIFNLQSSGFYRVNYGMENWNKLIQQLNTSHVTIHVLNRAQLIDDSFNLARAGLLDYSIALNLSTYLTNENDVIPWYTAIDCLSYVVERMRRSTEGYVYILSYVRNLADMIYNKTENAIINDKNHSTVTSWNKFSVWACYLDGEYCINNTMEYFKKWTIKEEISPDIKDAAFCTGIKLSNGTDAWRELFSVYTTSKSASEKNSAQTALTCVRDRSLLYKYLDFIFDAGNMGPVRLQDFKEICTAMSLTPPGIEALTDFLIDNIEKLLRTVPTGQSIVEYMYSVLASKVVTDNEIIKLYKLKNAPGLPPKIKSSFDKSYVFVEQNLRWYNLYHATINRWIGVPMETKPVTQSSNATSSSTALPETNLTSSTAQPTTIEDFDFDRRPPDVITRCPNKSGPPIHRNDLNLVFTTVVIITVFLVTSLP